MSTIDIKERLGLDKYDTLNGNPDILSEATKLLKKANAPVLKEMRKQAIKDFLKWMSEGVLQLGELFWRLIPIVQLLLLLEILHVLTIKG